MLLRHTRVLITRPHHQAQHLAWLVSQQGGIPLLYPTIMIAPPDDSLSANRSIQDLANYDLAIFTSANAVQFNPQLLIKTIANLKALRKPLKIIAIGHGTQSALRALGIMVDLVPSEPHSEGLLQLPALQASTVQDKKIAIFTGKGARDLLSTVLSDRQAKVQTVVCYQRQIPKSHPLPAVDIITCSSLTALKNLLIMAGGNEILQLPIIVINAQMAAVARQYGFVNQVRQARNAEDSAIIDALLHWIKIK